ncbi:MAG: septum formation initiator family protein [Candidatus Paceibacterota bacterium]
MRSFQKGGRLKHMMQSKIFLIFLGVLILVFFYNMFGLLGKMEETRKNRQIVEDKIAELEKTKEKLNSEITSLKTEKGVEESIREKFGLAKEGEGMIMVVDEKPQKEVEKTSNSSTFFSFFTNLFK